MNWGATFLNRFDFKVRTAGHLIHPVSGEKFEIDPEMQSRSYKRVFGSIVQFRLTSGIFARNRIELTAVDLLAADQNPDTDPLRQITGASGLDFADNAFHCLGIFSPSGWPEERKAQGEIRGNAIYYLVQKEGSTLWRVFGPEGSLKQLFDPETPDEKRARAGNALKTHARLILPGDQVAMDAFLEEQRLDSMAVLRVIQDSKGLFEIVEHKGKSYIQRSIR
jgi:hypothetical protein